MKGRQRPRKSIRTLLIFWLLIFSIVPLAAITGYSLVKYEQAIDQELSTRLLGNAREISGIFNEYQTVLADEVHRVTSDRALLYYLSANNMNQAREMLKRWFAGSSAHRIFIFNRDARLDVALYKDERGQVKRRESLETGVVELNEPLLKAARAGEQLLLLSIGSEVTGNPRKPRANYLELSVFSKVKGAGGKIIGYVEEAITLDEVVLRNIRNRLNAEIFFFQSGKPTIVSTHDIWQL
ncbi:MAG: hypothetical protein HC902_00595 [Calothrix sp. SM1_5_4]|nr:hypothetical protein [Calothrix sp. SM1_5_4]